MASFLIDIISRAEGYGDWKDFEESLGKLDLEEYLGEMAELAEAKAEASGGSTTSSGGAEFFANCTELRTKYPNGVPSSHPAYQSKMDKDKDNYACER